MDKIAVVMRTIELRVPEKTLELQTSCMRSEPGPRLAALQGNILTLIVRWKVPLHPELLI